MHHDPQMYPDPHSFMVSRCASNTRNSPHMFFQPERYLKDNVPSSESVNAQDARKRDHWAFGAG